MTENIYPAGMKIHPHHQHYVQAALARLPALIGQWMEKTLTALRSANHELQLAHDRNLLFQVLETLQRQRNALESSFVFHVQEGVESSERAQTSAPSLDQLKLSDLKLVDESEAEREIEISRTVQQIDLDAEWEWKELQAYAASLLGETKLRPEANPFRPMIFAKAMSQATQTLDLTPGSRNLLLREGARALAQVLRGFYAAACEELAKHGYKPLAYQAVTNPRPPKASDVNVTQPGALDQLKHRIPHHQVMAQGMPAPTVSASLDHALGQLQQVPQAQALAPAAAPRPPQTDPQTLALLGRLFEQMIKDEVLQPSVQQLIRRLQPSMMRAAIHDDKLVRTDEHPAWQLLNEVAAHAQGYQTQSSTEGLSTFLSFLEPLFQQLAAQPVAQPQHFQEALHQVNQFIDQQSEQELTQSQRAVAELETADQTEALRPLLREQITRQLAASRVSDRIREFLSVAWVNVLAKTMAEHGTDSDEAQDMLSAVDELLQSLQRPSSMEERDELRQNLPGLIAKIQKGMDLIALPAAQREAILDEMMIIHSKFLRARPKPPQAPTPEDIVRQLQEEMEEEDAAPFEHALRKQVLDTNVGSLATVPMAFGDAAQNQDNERHASEWVDSLQKGSWCKLFIQGHWASAHLLWYSANRQFYMFSSDHAGRMHSMTRRALERLRAEGLATSLEDRNLTQRAVDSLLQDLHTDSGLL